MARAPPLLLDLSPGRLDLAGTNAGRTQAEHRTGDDIGSRTGHHPEDLLKIHQAGVAGAPEPGSCTPASRIEVDEMPDNRGPPPGTTAWGDRLDPWGTADVRTGEPHGRRPWGSTRCPRGDTLHTHTAALVNGGGRSSSCAALPRWSAGRNQIRGHLGAAGSQPFAADGGPGQALRRGGGAVRGVVRAPPDVRFSDRPEEAGENERRIDSCRSRMRSRTCARHGRGSFSYVRGAGTAPVCWRDQSLPESGRFIGPPRL